MARTLRTISLFTRSLANLSTRRPLCVSFEITHNCNARCQHCHRGGRVREVRASPQQLGRMYRTLRSPVVQISGGEPLVRGDVDDIIRAIRQPTGTPYVILVTNAALLSRDRFREFRRIGVDQFSVSLDYPDERHDTFRSIPGLFGRIRDLVAGLDPDERRIVTFNSVIHSRNFRELTALAGLARDWGVGINFSPYTWLRTGDRSFLIKGGDLLEFHQVVEELLAFKRQHNTIRTADSFLWDIARFNAEEAHPGCRAGERFLVVNPDGSLSPCGLIMGEYQSREQLLEEFSKPNRCASCNTCIRAATERPLNNLVAGGLRGLRA
jgi:MoaA/NifB/PqqE/SkfB family radical SAM enzyme